MNEIDDSLAASTFTSGEPAAAVAGGRGQLR